MLEWVFQKKENQILSIYNYMPNKALVVKSIAFRWAAAATEFDVGRLKMDQRHRAKMIRITSKVIETFHHLICIPRSVVASGTNVDLISPRFANLHLSLVRRQWTVCSTLWIFQLFVTDRWLTHTLGSRWHSCPELKGAQRMSHSMRKRRISGGQCGTIAM